MGKLSKIFSALSFVCLAVLLTLVGVWAVTDLDFAVGGNITYTAPIGYTDTSILTFSCSGTEAWFVGCTDPDIEAISLPPTVTQDGSEYKLVGILEDAFSAVSWGYTNLKTVILPEGVLYLGEGSGNNVFAECSTLTKVVLPNTLVYIASKAFSMCDNLKTIEVPDSVVGLGDSWITSMLGLESVIIGSGCTDFDYRFAYDCPNLKNITFKGATPPTKSAPFTIEHCDALENIYVPSGSMSAYQEAEGFCDYANLIKAIP